FNWPNRVWSVGPSISWTVFDGGALRAGVEKQQALLDEAVLTYEQTVLTALHEVENSLVAAAREEERGRELARALAANEKALELATRLYREGQVDYLSVLDAQRSLHASEDALAQSRHNHAIQLIALFKALGGGWQEEL
ncbi:MAG: RND transporter, partial [Desulfobulbaceae bacterium A2]